MSAAAHRRESIRPAGFAAFSLVVCFGHPFGRRHSWAERRVGRLLDLFGSGGCFFFIYAHEIGRSGEGETCCRNGVSLVFYFYFYSFFYFIELLVYSQRERKTV